MPVTDYTPFMPIPVKCCKSHSTLAANESRTNTQPWWTPTSVHLVSSCLFRPHWLTWRMLESTYDFSYVLHLKFHCMCTMFMVTVQRRPVQDGTCDWVDGCPRWQSLPSGLLRTDWSCARSGIYDTLYSCNLLVSYRYCGCVVILADFWRSLTG